MDMHAKSVLQSQIDKFDAMPIRPIMASIEGGQRKPGVAKGARALWEGGLAAALNGQLSSSDAPLEISEHEMGLMPALARLANEVEAIAQSGARPLTLGGDHSIAFSSLEGTLRVHPDLRVIFIDAHGDINTPNTSASGSIHGMPLAAHLGLFGQRELPGVGFVGARLKPNQLAFIGVRDLDQAEASFIDDMGIACYSAEDVRAFGMKAVIRQVLREIDPFGIHPLHVSLDVDAADPDVAPATGTLVGEGLNHDEMDIVAKELAATGRVAALDIAEVNPELASTPADLRKTLAFANHFAATSLS